MTAKGNATDLMHFISKQMRMSHIYQPVMIKTLLANGGQATTEEIAKLCWLMTNLKLSITHFAPRLWLAKS